jgi:hypothetical protein
MRWAGLMFELLDKFLLDIYVKSGDADILVTIERESA